MVARCTRPDKPGYVKYSALGIDPDFLDYRKFKDFIGPMPSPTSTVERPVNGLGYLKGNVRWASRKEQTNNRACVPRYEFEGQSLTLSEWAELTGIPRWTLYDRIVSKKWSLEKALTKTVAPRRKSVTQKRVAFQGQLLTIPEWAAKTGISIRTLYARLKKGKALEEVFKPV